MENKQSNSDIKGGNIEEVVYKPLLYESGKEEVREKEKERKESWFLYFSALTVDLLPFVSGISLVWSSPAIPKLKSTDPNINPLGVPITPFEESWIASLPALGATIGPLLTGKLADTYGRKRVLIILAALKLACCVVLSFATNITLYYITRFLLGVGVGIRYAILPSYIGEICEDHNRGKFGCIITIFLTSGVLYTIIVGPLLSIKVFTLCCIIPLTFVIICFLTIIPETPFHLAATGKREEAVKALMKLRNKDKEAAKKDLLEILEVIEESSKSKGGYCELFKRFTLRKALMISVGLCSLQQISGINAIMAFIEPIFQLTGSKIPANISAIFVAAVQVFGVFLASAVVEKLGRKYLLLISTITCAISLALLGVYFYLRHNMFDYVENLFWLPVASLILYVLAFNFGLGPVPWAILSEIFPSNVKATAASLATSFCALSAFAVTFSFLFLTEVLGMANCFFVFAGFCLAGAFFIYLGVPETKGKNIVEIQKMLSKANR